MRLARVGKWTAEKSRIGSSLAGVRSLSSSSAASAEATLLPADERELAVQGDLEALVRDHPVNTLSGRYWRVGDIVDGTEVPRQFEKTEWNTKMHRTGPATAEEIKKWRETVPDRGGRWDPPSLVDKNERHLLLRPQALELCKELERASAPGGKPLAKVLLGMRGSGKSATLLTALSWARSAGWLTFYMPRSSDLVTARGALMSGTDGPVSILPDSTIGPNLFQQPNAAHDLLETLDEYHGQVLSLLPQRRKYKHDLYKPKGEQQGTLAHILMRGLAQGHRAADCVYDLRMELNLVEEVPVLIAVDEFNALYWPTALYFKSQPVPAHQLVLAKAFRFVKSVPGDVEDDSNQRTIRKAKVDVEHVPKRGAILGAVTDSLSPPPHKQQLAPARFGHFDIADASYHKVDRYTEHEVQRVLNWYQMRGACRPQSQKDVDLCRVFTAGVGEKVAQYALGSTVGFH